MAAQHADVNPIKKKRGQKFVIDDTKACVDAVRDMKPAGARSRAVFTLAYVFDQCPLYHS